MTTIRLVRICFSSVFLAYLILLHYAITLLFKLRKLKLLSTGQCRKLYYPDLDTGSYWYPR